MRLFEMKICSMSSNVCDIDCEIFYLIFYGIVPESYIHKSRLCKLQSFLTFHTNLERKSDFPVENLEKVRYVLHRIVENYVDNVEKICLKVSLFLVAV